MRARLARLGVGGLQPYWHIDTHWSRTIIPDVMLLQGVYYVDETAPARRTTTRARVTDAPSGVDDPEAPGCADQSWDSQPAARTCRGKSLLVGDSFTLAGVERLRPLFRHGRLLWIGLAGPDSIARAMAHSHTVVLEVVQRHVGRSALLQPAFREMLVKAMHR